MLRKGALGSTLAGLLVLATHIGAAAAVDPYSGSGYDYSYIQCGSAAPSAQFGIVGVNAGYPFTYYNSCLASEYASAPAGAVSLYVNTGYDPTYTAVDGVHTTQDCATASSQVNALPAQQAAWAVGCSEAERDVAYAQAQSASAPVAWWLDVETANSWSTSDLSLNRYSLQGLVNELRTLSTAPIGIYSTSSQWTQITGGYHPPVDATWVATGARTAKRARTYCTAASFTGAPIWLVQYVGSYDHDWAC
ncbi:MAG TPA: hypothetical protein VFL29_01700 [Candidatus Dormibacteraeota bacterium]|nr:hypothetical protein [Candidatus Dormibacteraeota bacterium]